MADEKTVRLRKLVDELGTPEWVVMLRDPKKDPAIQKAIHENRMMTVGIQTMGTKKEFGKVGYRPGRSAAYLMFPKPLTKYADRKVVGIDYDLVKEQESKGPLAKKPVEKLRAWRPENKKELRRGEDPASAGSVGSARPESRVGRDAARRVAANRRRTAEAPRPKLKTFRFKVKSVAELEDEVVVEGKNRSEAKKVAERMVEARELDWSKARVRQRIV